MILSFQYSRALFAFPFFTTKSFLFKGLSAKTHIGHQASGARRHLFLNPKSNEFNKQSWNEVHHHSISCLLFWNNPPCINLIFMWFQASNRSVLGKINKKMLGVQVCDIYYGQISLSSERLIFKLQWFLLSKQRFAFTPWIRVQVSGLSQSPKTEPENEWHE